MRIAVLSAANSSHTVKIVNSLASLGHRVWLYSLPNHRDVDGAVSPLVTVVYLAYPSYARCHKQLCSLLAKSRAEVLYAHYATGYGTLARKTGFQPTVLAVWGSDVYDFPHKSPIHSWLLRRNLAFAKVIFSTSHAMAEHTRAYTDQEIVITPFGVDLKTFSPAQPKDMRSDKPVRIGYLKTVSSIYGIEDLIRAFHLLTKRLKAVPVQLAVYGDGDLLDAMQQLVHTLGIDDKVTFYGRIPHVQAPDILRGMDILCVPSLRESFGVSAVEGMACGIPCVVSEADGLQEVTQDGVTGLTVPAGQPEALCRALEALIDRPEKRIQMGMAGRQRAEALYDWDKNIRLIESELKKQSDPIQRGGADR